MNFLSVLIIRTKLLVLVVLLFSFGVNAEAQVTTSKAESIPIYTYHNGGPFITSSNEGLTYELADYLNSEAKGRWTFHVVQQARLRFNRDIQTAKVGIVPWVKPAWLKKLTLTDDIWSEAYFKDANVIVSNLNNKIDYQGPESLFGHTVAKVKGAVQVGIDPYIDAGKIKVVNSTSFEGHFRMLYGGRADFVSTSLNIAKYTIKLMDYDKDLFISMRPIDQYTRHIMVLNNRQDILVFINDTIYKMATDPVWKKVMYKFGTQDLTVTEFD